ncbi:hypothetical protein [Nonomuraea sp. 10N515B]|uniref:hypothetical protein n=1 Tax=Nonomuraea sp. 10N515B TaxID=3457422 RepID=UPI003FCDE03A
MREVTHRSTTNGHRRKPDHLCAGRDAAVIEGRDRLAHFGVQHLETWLPSIGRRRAVLDPQETTDDLERDITEILTSIGAHLHGRRAAKNRATWAVAAATGKAAN